MHALREYIQDELDRRSWAPVDLVRASGINKQVVSSLLADDRPSLDRLPTDKTIDGLAKAFNASRRLVLTKIGEAMGIPVAEPVVVYDAERVPNDELLRVLAARLAKAGDYRGDTAPMNQAATEAATASLMTAGQPDADLEGDRQPQTDVPRARKVRRSH